MRRGHANNIQSEMQSVISCCDRVSGIKVEARVAAAKSQKEERVEISGVKISGAPRLTRQWRSIEREGEIVL